MVGLMAYGYQDQPLFFTMLATNLPSPFFAAFPM